MFGLAKPVIAWYSCLRETMSEAARPPPEGIKKALLSYERRVITMYITLADLIQFCLLLVALVVACYTIFKEKD